MSDHSTNGDRAAAVEAPAGAEDQGGVAELGFGAGGRVVPAGGVAPSGTGGVPDPELADRAKRRSFTAAYKAKILEQADACSRPGEIGALLRREGLYTSHLTAWRRQRQAGTVAALGQSRGRKPVDRRDQEITALKRKLERSEAELSKMKQVVEIQGKLSALLQGLDQDSAGSSER